MSCEPPASKGQRTYAEPGTQLSCSKPDRRCNRGCIKPCTGNLVETKIHETGARLIACAFPRLDPPSATSARLSPGTTDALNDPVAHLSCCACPITRTCVLGFFTSCRMDIPSVCQLLHMLIESQTKHCSSKILDSLPSTVTKLDNSQSILETILFNDDVCRHDAVILVDHPGVRAFLRLHVFRLNFEIAEGFPHKAVGPRRPPCS